MSRKVRCPYHLRFLNSLTYLVGLSFCLTLLINACVPSVPLLKKEEISFSEDQYSENGRYVGTLEGLLVNKKEKPVEKLPVDADLGEYLNLISVGHKTDSDGHYWIDLYWENKPYLLADVFPDPAQNSFTSSGLSYLKSARTVTVDIPIVVGRKQQTLTTQPVTMYSISYVLKRIADEVVNRRVMTLKFAAEDFDTGFPIVGATVTLIPSLLLPSADSLLAVYINRENLRDVARSYTKSFITQAETRKLSPRGPVEFAVMNYFYYQLSISHPEYHPVEENLYVEKSLDKIVRVTVKRKPKRIDIIDR